MKSYSDINLNFLAHPMTGDIVKVKDANAIAQSVKLLVMTSFYERAFRPEIGSTVSKLLFEPLNKYTSYLIETSIKRVLKQHEPRVKVTGVTVRVQQDEASYAVAITYDILNRSKNVTIEFLLKKS
jgi:phage baseplate assembly protein W